MHNRILTLDDLAKFCAENKLHKFSSNDSGYKLAVHVPSIYEMDGDNSNESMLFGKVKLLHTGLNRNNSNVTKEAAEKCLPGIKYKPLLANFCELDGKPQFTSHDMEINEDGSINYLEHQIGCFTVDEPTLEKEDDRYYIYATVAIPREYTKAAEIIERDGGTKVSAELMVNELSYDLKNKELLLEDIEVMGCTCLGVNPETGDKVQEGMEGARLDIIDFSTDNNSITSDLNQVIQDAVITALSEYNSQIFRKEEREMAKTKAFEEEVVVEDAAVEEEITETEETFEEEVTPSEETEETFEEEIAEVEVEETEAEESETEEVEAEGLDFSVTLGETKVEFKLGLQEELMAMQELVNATYADTDNDYYSVNIFPDNSTVEMYGLWSGKGYRQTYKKKKGCHSLVGDRCPIYAQWLTEDEMNQLENMKSNYSIMESKLSQYEAEPQKMEVLNSEEYSSIANSDEFKALTAQDAHFEMSVEELMAKCDEMLLNAAKSGKVEFAKEENHKVAVKPLMTASDLGKAGRYGSIFNRK